VSQSIKKELDAAREEKAFWQEFSAASTRPLSAVDSARLAAVQELAERRLAELERMASRYQESDGKIIGAASI
jgi:hypothetical protein